MKQYDKLAECLVNDSLSHHQSWAEIKGGPFVLITIEELRELWEAGENKGDDDRCEAEGMPFPGEKSPNFKTYLTSKGIKID